MISTILLTLAALLWLGLAAIGVAAFGCIVTLLAMSHIERLGNGARH